MNDKIDLIYDLLKQDRSEAADFRKEVRDSHNRTDEKLTKIETETSERLSKIEGTTQVHNEQLAEHMRRTDILESLHRDNEARIIKLEEPGKFRAYMRKHIIIIGKIAGALMAIGGAIAYFMGLF